MLPNPPDIYLVFDPATGVIDPVVPARGINSVAVITPGSHWELTINPEVVGAEVDVYGWNAWTEPGAVPIGAPTDVRLFQFSSGATRDVLVVQCVDGAGALAVATARIQLWAPRMGTPNR